MLNARNLHAVILFIISLLSTQAFGIQIYINVGQYKGSYITAGQRHVSNQTIDVPAGTYTWSNNSGSQFSYTLASDGTVTSLQPNSATGGANLLALNNVSINVNSGSYINGYFIDLSNPQATIQYSSGSIVSIPDLAENLYNASNFVIARYSVDTAGNITVLSGSSHVTIVGSELVLQNVTVHVDPQNYPSPYFPGAPSYNGSARFRTGPSNVVNIAEVPEEVYTSSPALVTRFTADQAGNLNILTGANSVTVISGSIVFNNVTASVDPGLYVNGYLSPFGAVRHGPSQFVNIPGVTERLQNIDSEDIILYSEAADGTITVTFGANRVTTDVGAIKFKNVAVQINPNSYAGTYFLFGLPTASGVHTYNPHRRITFF